MYKLSFLGGASKAKELLRDIKLSINKLKCHDCDNFMGKFYIKPYTGILQYVDMVFKLEDRYICKECHRDLVIKEVIK